MPAASGVHGAASSIALLPARDGIQVGANGTANGTADKNKKERTARSLCCHLSAGSIRDCLLQVACIAHFQSAPLSFLAAECIQADAQPADMSSPSLQLTAGAGKQRRARKRRAEEDEESSAEGERWQSRLQTTCLRLSPELTAVAQGLLGCPKKVCLHLGPRQMITCLLMG